MVGARTRVVDAREQILVPGYIDPHVHPATLTTPAALARFVLPLGTTAVVADTLQFWELGGLAAFRAAADALMATPLRFYWMIRPHAQSRTPAELKMFGLAAHAHQRRLDAGVHADPRLRRSPDPGRARARRGADRRVPDGDAEPRDLLRARRRSRRRGPRALRRHRPARRPRRAAPGDGDRPRHDRRHRRPAAGADPRAVVATRVHVRDGASRRAMARAAAGLRAARARALSGPQADQRGDQPAGGAADGAGRSARGPPGPHGPPGRARRQRRRRRADRWLADTTHH